MENILSNKYIENKKDISKEIKKELNLDLNLNENTEDEDDIDNKIFNGLLAEDKKTNTSNSIKINTNTVKEKKNTRNLDTYLNENNNLIDLNFISFGDVNSLYNFQNGKMDTNLNTNKRIDSKNKNNNINSNNNNKSPRFKNKLDTENNNSPKSPRSIENGSEDSKSPSGQKIKRKNSNGSLLNSNNNENKDNKDNTLFLSKQIFKINNLFGDKNKKVENSETKKEIVKNYWESKNYFKISSINKGNAILITEDDNIINFPAFLLPKGAKLGETYTFQIKSMDKGFIYKNQKANEIDNIQKKFLNPIESNDSSTTNETGL
jgi:hypothetical protein